MLRTQPFVPFRMHVSEGMVYDIRHPEMVILDGGVGHCGLSRSNQRGDGFSDANWLNCGTLSGKNPIHAETIQSS